MRKILLLVCALLCAATSLYAASEDVSIEVPWGRISATLSQPTEGSDAAVLIVAGSGPTDRNGNSGLNLNTYAYKMLSDGLVKSGYAVLRYDKRAIGGSYISPEDIPALTLDDYVEDAERCVAWLRARGFARVYVAGHSEEGYGRWSCASCRTRISYGSDTYGPAVGTAYAGIYRSIRHSTEHHWQD